MMHPENDLDYLKPSYVPIFQSRVNRIKWLRQNPEKLPALKKYYRDNPVQFICDFGLTYDPRMIDVGLPADIPFILFGKQQEWCEWVIERWKKREFGITEKSRESGVSWLAVSLAVTLCLFNRGLSIGFGSRKELLVDKIGNMDSLLEKARYFIEKLPPEFTDGWTRRKNSKLLNINFNNGSSISGEAGSNIGRGGRKTIYFVDEAAFLERPQLTEASLSQTTNCRIDISTPNGLGNPFAQKAKGGKISVFSFHWRSDPRKNDAWYEKQKQNLDPVTLAQEVDMDYAASVEGVIIPSAWIQSAVDAHIKLGIKPTGVLKMAWDVADEGRDSNALTGRHGILLQHAVLWSGVNGDILESTRKAFHECDELGGYRILDYDADGLGAGARGDAKLVNSQRDRFSQIAVHPFRGSAAVDNPTGQMVIGRYNEDFFYNRKAQSWWALRMRFQATHRAVTGEVSEFNPDSLISIDSKLPLISQLVLELAQPTYRRDEDSGKILVNKTPDGTKSPNLADSVMINYASNRLMVTTIGGARKIDKSNITRR